MHSIEQMISTSISPYLFSHSLTTSVLEQKSMNIMYRYLETVFFLYAHMSLKSFGILEKPSKVLLLSSVHWIKTQKYGSLA